MKDCACTTDFLFYHSVQNGTLANNWKTSVLIFHQTLRHILSISKTTNASKVACMLINKHLCHGCRSKSSWCFFHSIASDILASGLPVRVVHYGSEHQTDTCDCERLCSLEVEQVMNTSAISCCWTTAPASAEWPMSLQRRWCRVDGCGRCTCLRWTHWPQAAGPDL